LLTGYAESAESLGESCKAAAIAEQEIAMVYFGDHMNGWGWTFMTLASVLFWVALIIAIVALLRHLNGNNPLGRRSRSNAEELLAQRFARGDIDEAEYRLRLGVLAERADRPSHAS
jgi:putative membrane protein